MKKLSLLIPAILYIALLQAQLSPTNKQQAVQQAVIKMFDALSNRDSTGLKTYSTADVTFYEYGQIWNIDTLIARAITPPAAPDYKRTNSFEFINTTVDKTMAWVTYRLQSVIFRDGKQVNVEWLETVTLVKEKKQWKVNHLHSTLIKRS